MSVLGFAGDSQTGTKEYIVSGFFCITSVPAEASHIER